MDSGSRTVGIVLAGGAGRRVGGQDKGLLTLHGKPVIERVLSALRGQCDELLILANRNQDDYARHARVIGDEIPGHAGPLAGVAAALALIVEGEPERFADCSWLLTMPADCPDPPDDLLARLRAALLAAPDAACAYAKDSHRVQPLFALYSLKFRDQLLISARDAVGVHASPLRWHIEIDALPVDFPDRASAFRNLNTPDDFCEYERMHPCEQPGYPTRIALEQALEIVRTRSVRHRLPVERVELAEAQNRVLAEDVRAPHDLPPFANSAMDGFALRGADLPDQGERAFELIGDVFAGATSAPQIGGGQCVRITTGAPLPLGADSVVIKENVRVEGSRVLVQAGEKASAHVRTAGEDFAAGDLALNAGLRLYAAQLGVLAALGVDQVSVRRRPRVAVIVTGDELVPTGQPLGFGQIHESNGVMLAALLREAGAEVVSRVSVRDQPQALRAALLDAAVQADLILSSGGVSAGEADHLPALLGELGEIHFHKVRIKPGMPVLFGAIGACLCFGLPGNPVSAAVTFQVFVRVALRALLAESSTAKVHRARLAEPAHKKHARAELLRCALSCDAEGVLWATPHRKQGSGMLRGLVESDALVLLPEDARDLDRGAVVTVWP